MHTAGFSLPLVDSTARRNWQRPG